MSSSSTRELSACECPVCFLLLSGGRDPLSLPCGHTLCKVCVEQLRVQGSLVVDTFHCPLCRKLIKYESVSLNVTLKSLIEELLKERSNVRSSALNVPYQEITFRHALDRGAYGEVYCGQWRGNEVAVKVFASGQMTRESLNAFRREVFVMNCLRHPNVVLMMGACQTPPKLAILMEYVPGGSLYKVLHVDKVNLSLEGMCCVAGGVCRGLQYLHSINIVHRDLKSKNILLTSRPPLCQAKLCDFGMARMRLESATMTGNVGTVHWTAPEVMSNQRYQFPADVYSFGMVLYEMATGQIPFQELLPVAVMMAVAINKQQPEIPKHVLPTIAALIRRCVCWDAGSRPPVADVLSALADLISISPPDANPVQQADFSHSDSLGMVFLSVSESTDVGVELLSSAGQSVSDDLNVVQYLPSSTTDQEIAQQLEQEAKEFQLAQDAHLAEQLQLKENSYRIPSDLVPKPPMPSPKQVMKTAKMMKLKKRRGPSPPLPPPPPPPPPPLPRLTTNPLDQQHHLQLMKQVRYYGQSLRFKLRPVETVEKRPFRVGRVVDAHASNEMSLYTFQNLIKSFSRRLLNHISISEPLPPYPVGRVVSNTRGMVRHLSSFYNSSAEAPKLPDKIQLDLTHFHKGDLQKITPRVSYTLPSQKDIEEEKQQETENIDGFW